MELKETCDITEQYRKNWKKDRKRRKKMEPSEDILTRSWQVVSSQQWNELTKQWVITTLKAPADIITKAVSYTHLDVYKRQEVSSPKTYAPRSCLREDDSLSVAYSYYT